MNDIQLYIGDDLVRVDSTEISNVSVTYSLKDIKNYGMRNSSFTKPISVLQTNNTREIFGALFNINHTGGFDSTIKVYAELRENGLQILKGSLQVVSITNDTYEVVLFSNNVALFQDIGEKLITGNTDPSDNITFDPSAYFQTYTRDNIRSSLNADPSVDGTGICYPIIDYDNNLEWFDDYVGVDNGANFLKDDYPIFPAPAVKQIFDKILTKYGYSYTISDELDAAMEKMYMPFNNDFTKYTSDYKYAKYYLGGQQGSTVLVRFEKDGVEFSSGEIQPAYSIAGFTLDGSYFGIHVEGGYDYLHDYPERHIQTETKMDLPHKGTFIVDVSIKLYNYSYTPGPGTPIASEWYISTWNATDGNVIHELETLRLESSDTYYINRSIVITVSERSSLYIARSPIDSTVIPGSLWKTADYTLPENELGMPWGLPQTITITEKDSIWNGAYFDLNDLLPKDYKQADLVNDILKMFNTYVVVDDSNQKNLFIQNYDEFYSNPTKYDWSDKIDQSSINLTLIKNSFARYTNFNFAKEDDNIYYNYSLKYSGSGLNDYIFQNSTEFGSPDANISLSFANGILKTATGSVGGYNVPADGVNHLVMAESSGEFRTDWAPKILFANTVDISTLHYGSDSSIGSDRTISKWTTLSPRMYNDVDLSSNIFIGFSSDQSYILSGEESNENLFNKYYKEDILNNTDDNGYLLTAKFHLTSKDVRIGFNDKIWISNSKIGSSWYKVNTIKNYSPGSGLTEVELLKTNVVDSDYDISIGTNILTYTPEK